MDYYRQRNNSKITRNCRKGSVTPKKDSSTEPRKPSYVRGKTYSLTKGKKDSPRSASENCLKILEYIKNYLEQLLPNLNGDLQGLCSLRDWLECYLSTENAMSGKLNEQISRPMSGDNAENITTFTPDVNILVCIKSLCDILLGEDNSFWMNVGI